MSTLYRDAALTDARSDRLSLGVSVLVTEGRIAWIRPADDEGELPAGALARDRLAEAARVAIVGGTDFGGDPLSDPTAMWRIWRVA